jgi:L-lysine exporter family protein LysE/ArgO
LTNRLKILNWAAMLQSWVIFLKGFLTCASLIVAIGAQNSFVLRQAILRRHIFLTAITCVICDSILICLGIFGMGGVVALNPFFGKVICLTGILFLIWFGLRALLRALQGTSTLAADEGAGGTARSTILAGLGFSLLNPHAYLDAMVLLGGMATRFDGKERASFAGGAVTASACWFFLVAYGARVLLPLFRRPRAWAAFDFGIAFVMWWLAFGLVSRLI